MESLKRECFERLKNQNFDCLSVGVLDFKNQNYESFDLTTNDDFKDFSPVYDLASLTKPLTLGLSYLKNPSIFTPEMLLLLEHRGGLKAWGRLSSSNWKEQLSQYQIKETSTVYSDFSALRLMLEIERVTDQSLYSLIEDDLPSKVSSWLDIEEPFDSPITGMRKGSLIQGQVHDDNAFVIGQRVSHAGLFGNISSVCKTLLDFDKNYSLLSKLELSLKENKKRFHFGWDSVEDTSSTLAGSGATSSTFGHLGFTGTSIWIDASKSIGHVILSNATQSFWYERKGLNEIRRLVGTKVFSK